MLQDLLAEIDVLESHGALSVSVDKIAFDSREVEPRTLFVATRGTKTDGHQFIDSALDRGATAIVCEALPATLRPEATYIRVADSAVALGRIASAFYGYPSRKLHLVGITGTNGKTTTVTLLYNMFRQLGYKAGLISTVTYCIDTEELPSTHTTPDSIRLNRMMAEMVEHGCTYCFMEVSSHSLVQHRIEGLHFEGALFSNITHDHLDYHHTFAEYIRAKKMLFDALPKGAFALTNADDRNGMVMVQNTQATARTYALRAFADYRCRILETHFDGMLLNMDGHEVWVNFLGGFNAYNLLAVYAAARLLGAPQEEVLKILSGLHSVCGRFDPVRSKGGITAIVDYAHTPDALENVLHTIGEIRKPEQMLYAVVGCGGDRDRTKRPEMARIAVDNSSLTILTSDNPRSEEPEAIIAEMKSGLTPSDRYLSVTDRREAIRTAVTLARPGDIILVAGKGHETYQEIQGVRHHFDDKEVLRQAMDDLNK